MFEFYVEGSRPDGSTETLVEQQDGDMQKIIQSLVSATNRAPRAGMCHVALHIALPYSPEAEQVYAAYMEQQEANERKSMRRSSLPRKSK